MKTLIEHDLKELLAGCISVCNHCAVSCLNEKDVHMLKHCIQLDIDCADICGTLLAFVTRNSTQVNRLYAVCAAICTACADECEKHADHMEHCRQCATHCRECAEACMQMNHN